jgi:hypothetical protein
LKCALITVVVGFLALASRAGAAERHRESLSLRDAIPVEQPLLAFRLVGDSASSSRRSHHAGMIAETEVAPMTTLGVGILKGAPKDLGPLDWRLDPGAPRTRKAAVSFDFRF